MALTLALHQNALHAAAKADRARTRPIAFRDAPSPEDEPVIPSPHIFIQPPLNPSTEKSSDGEANNSASVPRVAECAIHLELLEVFYALKAKVLTSPELDAVLGIVPRPVEYRVPRTVRYTSGVHRGGEIWREKKIWDVKVKMSISKARRREKWLFFLRLAVVRFEEWVRGADLRMGEVARTDGRGLEEAGTEVLESKAMPPLGMLFLPHFARGMERER